MMNDTTLCPSLPLGLLEIDRFDTVLYYAPSAGERSPSQFAEIIGKNFLQDVMLPEQAGPFQDHLARFKASRALFDSLSLLVPCLNQGSIRIRVSLARKREPARPDQAETILVNLRKDQ
jgi:hypothetical protein